jgi:NADPH:quinone reductase-like Zn-dependent oxidoreductase
MCCVIICFVVLCLLAGTYAEYAVAHEDSVLPVPEGWSFNEAAAVPLAAMTAWQVMIGMRLQLDGWAALCAVHCASA